MCDMPRAWTFAWLIAIVAVFGAGQVDAQDWSVKAEAGLVAARGNTHTDTANARFDVARETERWKQQFAARGVYSSDDLETTAQRWDTRAQLDYNFDPRTFSFVSGRYEEDRFSGFEYQSTYAGGLGRRFIDTELTKFNVQIGAGYKVLRTSDSVAEDGLTFIPGTRETDLIGQLTAQLDHAITGNTRVINKFLTEAGPDNTSIHNDLSLQVNMTRVLALALGYNVQYNTNPLKPSRARIRSRR
jgi:putative salt-induced outer membrane protein